LEKIFNTIVDSFIKNKIGLAENFLSETLSLNLKENLKELYLGNQLKSAGIGDTQNVAYDNLFRGDIIYWLDRKNNNFHENLFFDIMDSFVKYLNETCYTGINSYEFHYTLYEKGSFYKKHIDQFRNNESRKYSMIMYLNDNWKESDGGELCIHHRDRIQNISPSSGKTVFFQSNELEHEVLITNKPRMSITGWLKS
jgi:SM-20-related protein